MNIKSIAILLLFSLLISCDRADNLLYQGYVESELIFLATPFSGDLEKKYVSRGDFVQKGLLLFKLDEEPESLRIMQNQAELIQAKKTLQDLKNPKREPEIEAIKAQIEQVDAQLELAELRLKRYQTLHQKQAIDKHSLDEASARFEELENRKAQYHANLKLALMGSRQDQIDAQAARINALEAQLKEAYWALSQKSIYAPESGIVFDVYYREGEFVPTQQPIASLLTPSNIRIEFFVPAGALANIKVGGKITFTCSGCKARNEATISYVSQRAEYIPPLVYSRENRDKLVFRIKARPKEPSSFKPGQPITITGVQHDR